jgi:CO/xanthine dehydrogenase Mo-binding subunit
MKGNVLGQRLPRLDAVSKATGQAQYTVDLKMPGMMYGKIMRSPLAHARIKSIDISKAKALPGVHAVITANDCPGNKFSFVQYLADKTILCTDKVRYVGDEIAAVAAINESIAKEAIKLIDIEYEELKAYYNVEDALSAEDGLIHEGKERNIGFKVERLYGDPDKAFDQCDYIHEDKFKTSKQCHCCLEVHNCIANWDHGDRLTIWTPTQAPHTQKQEVARTLGIHQGKVRIINSHMGGGFGGRLVMDMKLPIAAILSKKTGRPVKIVNTREEEFSTSKTRYGYTVYTKTGIDKNGKILARELRVIGDNGAYHDKGPATLNFSSMMWATLYRVPNLRYEGMLVYTNKQMGTAYRGFGNPQCLFATESQLDMLAEKSGMDPLELRMKNCNTPNTTLPGGGGHVSSCGMKECMEEAAKASEWQKKRLKNIKTDKANILSGIGMANSVHTGAGGRFYGYVAADAFCKLADEGTVSVVTSGVEMGQGIHTAVAQIVAEEIGVPLKDVFVISNDTDLTPYDLGCWGSRGTFVSGNAALAAARNLKAQIVEVAKEYLNSDKDITIRNAEVFIEGETEKKCSLAELMEYSLNTRSRPLSARGTWQDELMTSPEKWDIFKEFTRNIPAFAFGTVVAEVEIDTESGQVRVVRVTQANDTGVTINPTMAEGQMEGAVMQGIGLALMEKLVLENGKVINDGFLDYKIPNIGDIPEIKTIFIESNDPKGPFGAKGIGEYGLDPVPAAIRNAIYDACNIKLNSIPIMPEHILAALEEKQK